MTAFSPNIRDMEFVLAELAGLDEVAALPGYEEASRELVHSVLEEAGRIAAEVLAPLNAVGDRQGAKLVDGKVALPEGWEGAFRTMVEGNWTGLPFPAEWGGMGLPGVVNVAVAEMWQAANMAFTLCPMLTQGAVHAILECASEEQKAVYLPKLVTGEWAGTMNLTESSAGSDLGAIRTKAVPQADGSYLISGQKIFITYGDHELAENIIHLVLARLPDAPPGVKGISLFIVPKFMVSADGTLGARNDVAAVSLEHKLGIHASPTCVMSFGDNGGATGFLVGQENRGLEYMFVMMNHARLNVGVQGLGIAERAYQQARAYARERVQGKPAGAAAVTPIVDHADVRRMLMTIKANVEAMRALAYVEAAELDKAHAEPDADKRAQSFRLAEFLNPVVKGWSTETGFDMASLGVQVHGGMGYVEETGAAQHLRDARITAIYEGTTAIQANDLVNRKILRDKGATAKLVLDELAALADELAAASDSRLKAIGTELAEGRRAAADAVEWILSAAPQDPRLPAAAAVPLLKLMGVVLGGYQMARAAKVARARLDAGEGDLDFFEAKLNTAWFYAEHVLPQAPAFLASITRGADAVMTVPADQL
ncbi:acyl-CoA dehydrogenase [Magnetospirillum aberrantis]|uniref:3-methylmercaptopropionyl-CoA dehydrogenase n=1 Tax=Magnetospirillum aberrantis SpK TaxID=908842 RepID=A0A7C9UXN9_9PROT|nr:acyl-CoA dehydrogenase [Magnetospirillum aberrantis]NFV79231.1 acyl-CoA dehydrogenase [Magnetospirillum aberrantis SpK]